MQFENLLKPGKIGGLELKNRIVMPAMGTELPGEQGEVTDAQISWLTRRAKGGAGLVISENCFAAPTIDPLKITPHSLRADDSSYIPGLAHLANTIHQSGAKAGMQLTPGGGAQAIAGSWIPVNQTGQKIQAVSPAGVPGIGRTEQPRVLTIYEIEKIAELCGFSASNIKQAGFDLIEIHAHGGYLIGQFLSPYFNKRTDEYGGSLDNRCRFLLNIVAAIRKAIGSDFPLTVKYSIADFLPGGWDVAQSQILAKKLEEATVNGIGISCGVHGSKMPGVLPYFFQPGSFLPFAEAIKKVVGIPVFVGGRLNKPRLAEIALRDGKADFVYEGRALIADPDWPQKVARGEIEEIRPCLACNECLQTVFGQQPVRCTVNAAAGREGAYDSLKSIGEKKKVLIVGGGPGGMEAARAAALRGYKVVLFERYKKLGGLALLAGVHNQEITTFVKWIVAQIRKLPIEIRRQTEITPALVEEMNPDVVILANGGTFVAPEILGIDRHNVFSSQDLLRLMQGIPISNKGTFLRLTSSLGRHIVTTSMVRRMIGLRFPIKGTVAIIGGQYPGCSLALLLAHKGKKVIVVEESDHFGKDMAAAAMVAFKTEIEKGNIKILTSTKINEVTGESVILTDAKGNKTLERVDSVIVALELAPSQNNLTEQLKDKVEEIYTIGDAKSFQRIVGAVSDAYLTVYNM